MEDRVLRSTVFTAAPSNHGEACRDLFRRLQKSLKKEMRLWWDIAALTEYVKQRRIPRGLRIKKFPSFEVADTKFNEEWCGVLNETSFKLMELIIKYKHDSLVSTHDEISKIQEDLQPFKETAEFLDQDSKLNTALDNLEAEITKTKRSKSLRDRRDYTEGKVYNWDRRAKRENGFPTGGRKASILTTNSTPIAARKRVSFSETDGEMSMPSTSSAGSGLEGPDRKSKIMDMFSDEGEYKYMKNYEGKNEKKKRLRRGKKRRGNKNTEPALFAQM